MRDVVSTITVMENASNKLTESRNQMHVGFDRVRVEIGENFSRHDILDSDMSESVPRDQQANKSRGRRKSELT